MAIARFKKPGMALFNQYLDKWDKGDNALFPDAVLSNPAYVEIINSELTLKKRPFETRFEAGRHLYYLLEKLPDRNLEKDVELWAWLTAQYIDVLCPITKNGKRKVRERARYIPEVSNYKNYYRHLLLGPYLIYKTHNDNPSRATALLCQPAHIISDVVEQLVSRQEIITNKSVVQLVTNLYYDSESESIKRGAGGKGSGSPRRLVRVLDQFDLTYDLYEMSVEELTNLLPDEFNKFL